MPGIQRISMPGIEKLQTNLFKQGSRVLREKQGKHRAPQTLGKSKRNLYRKSTRILKKRTSNTYSVSENFEQTKGPSKITIFLNILEKQPGYTEYPEHVDKSENLRKLSNSTGNVATTDARQ